jgi:heme exporter protein A
VPPPELFPPLRLVIEGLALERGQRDLVAGLTVTVEAGQILAVTGENGTGKSTLLRAIAGLLAPAAGTIRLEGPVDPEAGVAPHAHYVGHAEASRANLTSAENLDFWAATLGGARIGASAREALDLVGLPQVADLPVAYLSAGQRRRVALARVLVAPRSIWLLDEPLTALDMGAQRLVTGLMRAHLAQGGLIVAATHADLEIEGLRELHLGEPE